MTKKQKNDMLRLARKYRLLAGNLLWLDKPRVDKQTGELIQIAHDAICKAFMHLEDVVEGDTNDT